jgi:hypothetical protein
MRTEYRFEGKTLAFFEQQYGQLLTLQQGINGALAFLLSQEGLEGQWNVDWPNRRLVRQDAPREQQEMAGSAHELARNGLG